MSDGSHNYIYIKIQDELCGQMGDPELNDLMDDIAELAYQLECADSGDTDHETYQISVSEFKKKWFKSERSERLKTYIDNQLEHVKKNLYEMLG